MQTEHLTYSIIQSMIVFRRRQNKEELEQHILNATLVQRLSISKRELGTPS